MTFEGHWMSLQSISVVDANSFKVVLAMEDSPDWLGLLEFIFLNTNLYQVEFTSS